jgi:hypothetical protein
MMRRTRVWFNGTIVALPTIVVEMHCEHPPMGLTQDVDDRVMVCIGERNRWCDNAQRVGHDHHGCSQTPQRIRKIGPHLAYQYDQISWFGRDVQGRPLLGGTLVLQFVLRQTNIKTRKHLNEAVASSTVRWIVAV